MISKTQPVLQELAKERLKQDEKWGVQNHPNGTGYSLFKEHADLYKKLNNTFGGVWAGILLEEVYEALSERDPNKLREELCQVGAVAVAWIESLDRRKV